MKFYEINDKTILIGSYRLAPFVSYKTNYIHNTILVISYPTKHFISRVKFLLSSVRRWPFFKKYGLSIFIYLYITCIHDTYLQYLAFIYYCI